MWVSRWCGLICFTAEWVLSPLYHFPLCFWADSLSDMTLLPCNFCLYLVLLRSLHDPYSPWGCWHSIVRNMSDRVPWRHRQQHFNTFSKIPKNISVRWCDINYSFIKLIVNSDWGSWSRAASLRVGALSGHWLVGWPNTVWLSVHNLNNAAEAPLPPLCWKHQCMSDADHKPFQALQAKRQKWCCAMLWSFFFLYTGS